MPINEMRSIATFVKAAELGSLRRAAAAQQITHQAASQALAQLERESYPTAALAWVTSSLELADTPEARLFALGIPNVDYSPTASRRSWAALQDYLDELFG